VTELYLNPVEVSALKTRIELNNRQIAECQQAFNGLLLAIFDGHDMEFPEGRPQIDLTPGAEKITWEGENDGSGVADAGEGIAGQHGHQEGAAGPTA
jgi:hypothetical protein